MQTGCAELTCIHSAECDLCKAETKIANKSLMITASANCMNIATERSYAILLMSDEGLSRLAWERLVNEPLISRDCRCKHVMNDECSVMMLLSVDKHMSDHWHVETLIWWAFSVAYVLLLFHNVDFTTGCNFPSFDKDTSLGSGQLQKWSVCTCVCCVNSLRSSSNRKANLQLQLRRRTLGEVHPVEARPKRRQDSCLLPIKNLYQVCSDEAMMLHVLSAWY